MSNANNKYALANIAIFLYFLFFNPLFAVTLTAITNIFYKRINKVVFFFSFCLAWALSYFIRDFTIHAGDIVGYLEWYHYSQFRSFQEIIYSFFHAPIQNELFWHLYNKLFSIFFGYSPFLYVLITYAFIFFLIASLGYLINNLYFPVIIFFILLLNLGVLYNVFYVWRHSIASLLFLIGVYHNKIIISRIFIYSATLFHLVAVPLIIIYEVFLYLKGSKHFIRYTKLFSQSTFFYCLLFLLGAMAFEVLVTELSIIFNLHSFSNNTYEEGINFRYQWLFIPLSLLLMFSLWSSRAFIHKTDLFFGLNYYLFVFISLLIQNIPSIIWGRAFYVLLFGVTIVVAKYILLQKKSTIIIIIIIVACYRFYTMLSPEISLEFKSIAGGDFNSPFSGVLYLLYNYDYYNMYKVLQ